MMSLFTYESDVELINPGQRLLDEFDLYDYAGGSYLIVAKNASNKTEFTEFFLTHDTTSAYITNLKTTSDTTSTLVTANVTIGRNHVRLFITTTEALRVRYYKQSVSI